MRTLMIPTMVLLVQASAVAVIGVCPAVGDDTRLETEVDGVRVQMLIPSGVRRVRGAIVHAAHGSFSARWTETSRQLEFAHVLTHLDLKRSNRPRLIQTALVEGLAEFAQQAQRAELATLPLAFVGHSAGGGFGAAVANTLPDRAIGYASSCSWVTKPEGLDARHRHVPSLFSIGSVPDAFNMLPAIPNAYDPGRKQGLPWGLALQWDCAHEFANNSALFVPWVRAAAALRLPEEPAAPGEAVKLRPIDPRQGWLGDRASWEGNLAKIASYDEYRGDRSAAVWLPDRATAFVWRAFMSKNPPVYLEAATADGRSRLGPPKPRAGRELVVPQGTELILSAVGTSDAVLAAVELYEEDRLVGRAEAAPWQLPWPASQPGVFVFHVQWTTAAGNQGASNPVLVVVKAAEID